MFPPPATDVSGRQQLSGSAAIAQAGSMVDEAIATGLLGQIGEVLVDNETALLVEPGNARELADTILRLSGSPELRARLGAAARHTAIERHTWKQNAQRVIDEYRALSEPPAVAGG